jgi:hypothetical protein
MKYLSINYRCNWASEGIFKVDVKIVILIIFIIVGCLVFNKIGASFSFEDAYGRRITARETLNGPLAYMYSASTNGLAPMLAFLSVYNRKYVYLLGAIIFSLLGFAFTGTKGPIAYVLLLSFLGFYFSRGGSSTMRFILIWFLFLAIIAAIDWFVFDRKIISDIYVRRVHFVAPQIQMFYLDYIFNAGEKFSLLTGSENNSPISYIIGDIYLNNPLANANTVTFLTTIGRFGFLGYFFSIGFLIVFFNFLTYMFNLTSNKVWLSVAVMYSILLLEQSYSTAFISSGIFLCVVMLLIFKVEKKEFNYDSSA